jgi:hypothetical protein
MGTFSPKVRTKTDMDIVIANLARKPDLDSILAVVLVPPYFCDSRLKAVLTSTKSCPNAGRCALAH